ncbi:ABC transporter permease [Clostridium amazonitimonense]|uniref:ABC transporter permease n=1 Tax=Clostridium amazonitimonense TaxID=1499689 RepID=UPI00050967AA|nr:ABC transporter permease [Clostridium amazonitimonense]
MLNLMKLEIKKFKLERYMTGVFWTNLILIVGLFVAVGIIKYNNNLILINNLPEILSIIDTTVRVTFVMFASVILSKIVISEYSNKTINLMFMYPISRKKIFLSKLLIVVAFTFINIIISTIVLTSLLAISASMIDISPWNLTFNEIVANVPTLLLNAALSSGTALIPLYFGMKKKSVPTTILSAFLICCVMYSQNGIITLSSILPIAISVALIGVFVVVGILNKLDIEDVI